MSAYEVIGYDTFSRESFRVGFFPSRKEAIKVAKEQSGSMTLMYVYDRNGKQIARYGEY